jgi:hypothetical protein
VAESLEAGRAHRAHALECSPNARIIAGAAGDDLRVPDVEGGVHGLEVMVAEVLEQDCTVPNLASRVVSCVFVKVRQPCGTR